MRLLLVLTLLAAACATTSPTGSSATGHAADYYPLAVGNTWTYRAADHEQTIAIVEKGADGFYVDNLGGHFAPRADGVFDGQRFLLQEPLVVEHSWVAMPRGQPRESYRISAVDAVVTVPAGTFNDCIQVDTEQVVSDGKLLVTWSYAKGVGMVKMEQRHQQGSTPPQAGVVVELLSFKAGAAP